MRPVLTHLLELPLRSRRFVSAGLHIVLIALSSFLAFWLRFDGSTPPEQADLWLNTLGALIAIRALIFVPFRLFEGIWRYTSLWDLRNIVLAVVLSSGVFYALIHGVMGQARYPRSIYIIDAILLICFMVGIRLARRIHGELLSGPGRRRVLIYGAGDAGEMIVRQMRVRPDLQYDPIGFIDDERSKRGLRIHGVRVLGGREDLPRIVSELAPEEVLIAMPGSQSAALRRAVRALEHVKIRVTTVPNIQDLLDGRLSISAIRSVTPEDLLSRPPIGLDPVPLRRLVRKRRILVTGAGGSIGSELCRQIAALGPGRLLVLDRHENSVYEVLKDLRDRGCEAAVPVIADVTDYRRIDAIMREHRPEIIFHAAAHKHVPLMERHPSEAVKNNVRGTRVVLDAAMRHRAERMILVSTDKAVNPSSVMGATKRVAELMLLACGRRTSPTLMSVRFGNVLGSNGSVLLRFQEQVRAGGPVTVTHPEMRRFFMLIPEAVHLVLHAAATGVSQNIYVLDMGEPVKMLDVARNVIRLSGFIPDEEIPIQIIGLREGEKLYEELVAEGERAEPSRVRSISQVHTDTLPDPDALKRAVRTLERLARVGDEAAVMAQLRRIVPNFTPDSVRHRSSESALPSPEPAAPAAPAPQPAATLCPACRSEDFHRSRARTLAEHARKGFTEDRLFRCRACGWRGWFPLLDKVAEAKTPAASSLERDVSWNLTEP